jgi:hypothetical protein
VQEPEHREMRNSDAAKRMADIVRLHQMALSTDELLARRYVAIRLSDGGSDGVAYESREDAISHQFHETLCGYFEIPRPHTTWGPQTCDSLLWYTRSRYNAGYRAAPNAQLILPMKVEDLYR